MALFAFTNAAVTVNSVDLSDHVRKVTLSTSAAQLDSTAMGATYIARIGGLLDTSWQIEFNQDFGAAKIDATVWPLLGTATTVTVRPVAGAGSATNPQYSQSVLVCDYKPLDGQVGALATTAVQWPGAGTLSRFTT